MTEHDYRTKTLHSRPITSCTNCGAPRNAPWQCPGPDWQVGPTPYVDDEYMYDLSAQHEAMWLEHEIKEGGYSHEDR